MIDVAADPKSVDFLALDVALPRMEQLGPRMHRVVMLRFSAGLNIEETAHAMDLSSISTVKREWSCARAWLYRTLKESDA